MKELSGKYPVIEMGKISALKIVRFIVNSKNTCIFLIYLHILMFGIVGSSQKVKHKPLIIIL